jgi:hypothetical protein
LGGEASNVSFGGSEADNCFALLRGELSAPEYLVCDFTDKRTERGGNTTNKGFISKPKLRLAAAFRRNEISVPEPGNFIADGLLE